MSERREDVAMAIHAVRISPPQFEPFPEDYALADAAIFAYEATHPEPTDAEVETVLDVIEGDLPGFADGLNDNYKRSMIRAALYAARKAGQS
jgi:hypothetical protein